MARQKPESSFLEVKCSACGNEQAVFDKPAQDVNCQVCEEPLVEATGGKGEVKAEILKKLD